MHQTNIFQKIAKNELDYSAINNALVTNLIDCATGIKLKSNLDSKSNQTITSTLNELFLHQQKKVFKPIFVIKIMYFNT